MDIPRYPEWMPDESLMVACSKGSEGPVGKGTTYTDHMRLGAAHGVVEVFEPPRRVVFHYTYRLLGMKLMEGWPGYELEPRGERRTRVRHRARARLFGFLRPLRPLVRRMAQRERGLTVAALKTALEEAPG